MILIVVVVFILVIIGISVQLSVTREIQTMDVKCIAGCSERVEYNDH